MAHGPWPHDWCINCPAYWTGNKTIWFWQTEAVVLLENVAKHETAGVLVSELRKRGYVTMCCFINSVALGLPQSRTRLYVAGINMQKANVTCHPSIWAEKMEAITLHRSFLFDWMNLITDARCILHTATASVLSWFFCFLDLLSNSDLLTWIRLWWKTFSDHNEMHCSTGCIQMIMSGSSNSFSFVERSARVQAIVRIIWRALPPDKVGQLVSKDTKV